MAHQSNPRERIRWAQSAVDHHSHRDLADDASELLEFRLIGLVTSLRHFTHANCLSWSKINRIACDHFTAERDTHYRE